MVKRVSSLALLLGGVFALTTYAAGPTFRPDVVFRGSSLTGWTPLGQADWRAQNGEIIGTPKAPDGGWLVLEQVVPGRRRVFERHVHRPAARPACCFGRRRRRTAG